MGGCVVSVQPYRGAGWVAQPWCIMVMVHALMYMFASENLHSSMASAKSNADVHVCHTLPQDNLLCAAS